MDMDHYWKQQWADFCPHFSGDKACVNLQAYGGPDAHFLMAPGGGFGDLSHPTTKLCITLLCKQNSKRAFIDIGCGSGVLSIAANALGFSPIFAIDCDDHAIKHTKENSRLNKALITTGKQLPPILPENPLVIMNMISSEAKHAWQSAHALHTKPKTLITSGILSDDKDTYLNNVPCSYGHLQQQMDMDGWSAFIFTS